MGKSVSVPQPSVKKGKASGLLRKLICETQSFDEGDDGSPSPTAATADPIRPWRADFMNYLNTVEAKPPPGMSIIQWWGVCINVILQFLITDCCFAKD